MTVGRTIEETIKYKKHLVLAKALDHLRTLKQERYNDIVEERGMNYLDLCDGDWMQEFEETDDAMIALTRARVIIATAKSEI